MLLGCSGGAAQPDGGVGAPDAGPGVTSDGAPADGAGDRDAGAGDPPAVRLMLHGGGAEDDELYRAFVEAAGGGHIVTLGAVSNPETYPDLLFWDGYFVSLGAASAETLNTESATDADAAAVVEALRRADGIYIRGGNQANYLAHWRGRALEAELRAAYERGAVLGGSSAGAMVLASPVYDARVGGVTAYEALLDAHDSYITFADELVPALANVVVDTHCTERGRVARALVLALRAPFAEAPAPLSLCVDPRTAAFVRDDGSVEVKGRGAVLVLDPSRGAFSTEPGAPPTVEGAGLWSLPAGYVVDLEALRRGEDPVRARPAYVTPNDGGATSIGPLQERTLDGSDASARALGTRELVGLDGDMDAWRDRAIQTVPGSGTLPSTIVLTRLYDDSDFFENHLGGAIWAVATEPSLVLIALDLGMTATVAPPATITPASGDYVLVIDPRTATHAGAPDTGWQTAALEGARLRVLTSAWDGAP